MSENRTMMTFTVNAEQNDALRSTVRMKDATFSIDTSPTGVPDVPNPVELLLAALAACLIKGVERVAPTLGVEYSNLEVQLEAHRPSEEPRIEDINYVVRLTTESNQGKLDLLHKNLMKFGTIFNTVKSGTRLEGRVIAA